MKIWRIRSRDLPKYGHPNGWIIQKGERDWSLRGFGERGIADINTIVNPKTWYEIHRRNTAPSRRHSPVESFTRLREARAWCDQHTAE